MEPERANMCIMSMQYLILMRPLVRGLALDVIEQMWRGERLKEAKGQAEKVMRKRRPGVLEQPPQEKVGIVDVSVNRLNAAPVPVKVRSLDPRKRGLDQYTDNGGYVESQGKGYIFHFSGNGSLLAKVLAKSVIEQSFAGR
jgi:hypothetical protein